MLTSVLATVLSIAAIFLSPAAGGFPFGGFGGFGGPGPAGFGGFGPGPMGFGPGLGPVGFGPGPGPLAPLHGPCMSSTQCAGVAICVQMVCECPAPLYRAVGGHCQVMTFNTFHAVPAVRTSVVYAPIGFPCGPATPCGGGGVCLQGTCGCGPGLVVSGPACVPGGGPFPGPGPVAPFLGGFGPFPAPGPVVAGPPVGGPFPYPGPGPVPVPGPGPLVGPGFGGCGGGCFGGRVCVQNVCRCPSGYVARAGVCGPLVPVSQVPPGGPCVMGEECTGGSICVTGACCCPDGLMQIGAVCIVPPPPLPAPAVVTTVLVAPGHPCGGFFGGQCVPGAVCVAGACACGPSFVAAGPGCLRRRK